MSENPHAQTIQQAVSILNAHGHRGYSDWWFDLSLGLVVIAGHETVPIHPIDAKVIAAYYWHRIEVVD